MRTTLRLDSSVIQTLPPPTAMPRPSAPVLIGLPGSPVAASILVTVCSAALVTQTAPPSTATAVGVTPTGIVWTTRFVCRVIRDTVASKSSPPRTAGPDRDPARIASDVDALDDDARAGIDARDRAVLRIRHPHRPVADCHACRAVADRDRRYEPIRPRIDRRNRMCRNRVESGLSSPVSSMTATATAAERRKTAPIAIRTPLPAADLVDRDGGLPRRGIQLNSVRRGSALGSGSASAGARGRSIRSRAMGRRRAPRRGTAGIVRRPGAPLLGSRRRRARASGAGSRSRGRAASAIASCGPLGRLRGFAGAQAGVCKAIERAVEDVCQLAALSLDPDSILPGKKR